MKNSEDPNPKNVHRKVLGFLLRAQNIFAAGERYKVVQSNLVLF